MENKKCSICSSEFVVTDDDLGFLEKISPELNGQLQKINSPKLCHSCRQIRRYGWRNERHLYKRKCDLTGEDVISVYSPDKPFKVYSNTAFSSDKWDPMEYGVDFDFSRGFFEQFRELIEKVPRQANNAIFNENCDYCNQTWHSKDSYMSFNLGYGERCFYCNESFYVKDCVDCFDIRNCEYCYFCFDSADCNNSTYLEHCKDMSESHFCFDCKGCQNVFLCTGLNNKQYYIENKQHSQEEYEEKIKEFDLSKRSRINELRNRFNEIKKNAVHKENNNIKAEDCTGDYIIESKNCHDCYNIFKSENCERVGNIDDAGKDCRDINYLAESELCYEGTSIAGYKNIFSVFMAYGSDNYYCNFCDNCKHCFGCAGLKRKEYCIFNKQYSKEEYENLFAKIVDKMRETGEWGEFFPSNISLFAYNESVANDYHPKSKEEAEKIGAYWQDNNYDSDFSGEFYEPKDDIGEYQDEGERTKLLSGVLRCEKTGRAFKLMPQELLYYVKHQIPIPTVHYQERFKELFLLRNPRQLFERQCDCNEGDHEHSGRCERKFKTTYSQDRREKVYCEECYLKTVG